MKQFLPVAWALVLGMLPATAWREWSHFGHGTSKWKRNWVPTSEQNRSYYNGKNQLLFWTDTSSAETQCAPVKALNDERLCIL